MFFRVALLLCVLTLAASFAFADNLATQTAFLSPEGRIARTLDNPEPDTLMLDGDFTQFAYFATLTNYWVYQRFTTPAAFQLRSIYVYLRDSTHTENACSVFVCLPNGTAPGTVLSSAVFHPTDDVNDWYDVTLPDSVDFTANQDFMIVVGRANGIVGWAPGLDQAHPTTRFYYTNPNAPRTGPYTQLTAVSLHVRAGGSIAHFTDLSSDQCYDSVANNRGAFFMLPNTQVELKNLVTNHSDATIASYFVKFSVQDPVGSQIFADSIPRTNIAAGGSQIVRAINRFTVTTPGEYMARAVVHTDSDAVADNDTTWLRLIVGGYPLWLRYDDNLTSDGISLYPPGNMTAVSFRAPAYPTRVDTVRVYVGDDDPTARMKLYLNNAQGIPSGLALWTSTVGVVQGWNNIAVTPPHTFTTGQKFTVALVHGTGGTAGIGKDANPPNAAAISRMDSVAWQSDGTNWSYDALGNWMIQAHLDTAGTSAVGDHETTLPASFSLAQNFPNPFNPTTDIQFTLPVQSRVRLTVYDILGQEVAMLVNGSLSAGAHTAVFNGATLPSGIYFYRLEAGSFSDIRKMMLMK